MYLFSKASRLTMGPNQPPIPWTPGLNYLGVEQPGREAVHSSTVNNMLKLYFCSPSAFMACIGATLLHLSYEYKSYLIHVYLTPTSLKQ